MTNIYLEELIATEAEYKRGEINLLRAYTESKRRGYEELVLTEICWEQDHADLIDLIRKAKLNTFLIADGSSALLETLHTFIEEGFLITGAKMMTRQNATQWDRPIKALEITVK